MIDRYMLADLFPARPPKPRSQGSIKAEIARKEKKVKSLRYWAARPLKANATSDPRPAMIAQAQEIESKIAALRSQLGS